MKKFILIMLCICPIIFMAQDYNSFFTKGLNSGAQATEVVPPSSESFLRMVYGNTSVKEFKGYPNVSIPLHNLISGNLKESIVLNYSKPGVKVNDVPNITGMNWILETGGIITRTIYDLADDYVSPQNRILLNRTEFENLLTPSGAETMGILAHDITGAIDNEIDIFNYSVGGFSGSFYLDEDYKPKLFTQNYDLKIESVGDFKTTYTFKIITNEGIKYTFGGSDAIEKTSVRMDVSHSGVTSFFLKEIEDTAGKKISYTYNNVSSKIINMGELSYDVIQVVEDVYQPISGSPVYNPVTHAPITQSGVQQKILRLQNARSLYKITTDNEEIIFNYLPESGSNQFSQLENIVIKKNGVPLKKIVFNYINNFQNSPGIGIRRFFLSSVKEFSIKNNVDFFVNDYLFEYEDPFNIPERLSKSVDYLGYFNGKNNGTLLPNINLFGASYLLFNQSFFYADRRSDFNFAKKGTLTSITYPTKGKTFFEYEGIDQKGISVKTLEASVGMMEGGGFIGEQILYADGDKMTENKLNIKLYIVREFITSGVGPTITANLKIYDKDTDELLSSENIMVPMPKIEAINAGIYTHTKNYTFISEPARKYKMILSIQHRPQLTYNAHSTITYRDGYKKENGPGLRLKKIYDVNDNDSILNIKRIYYSKYENINNFNIINLPFSPDFTSRIYEQVPAFQGPLDGQLAPTSSNYQTILNSEMQDTRLQVLELSDFEPEYVNDITDPIYPNVTISYGGDHFEKGGEERKYDITGYSVINSYLSNTPNTSGMAFSTVQDNESLLSDLVESAGKKLRKHFPLNNMFGRLVLNRVFNNKNGDLFLSQSTSYNYDSMLQSVVFGVAGLQLYQFVVPPPNTNPNHSVINYYVSAYHYPSYSSPLDNSRTTEYLEDVPLNTSDDSTYKKLVTISNYFYNNPVHHQLTDEETVFPDGSIISKSYRYASDKGNQKLINANMVGIPLETETRKNNRLIKKMETRYDHANLFPSAVLSYGIQPNISPTLEYSYNQYDDAGNLLQYTNKGGLSTSIIWGYNQTQPIAKIEGATYSELQSLVSVIISASDTDAAAPSGNDETALLALLDAFRKMDNLKNYQITTYTYDPLIGVRSITPPSGIRQKYIYDAAHRLEKIVHEDGKVLQEYKYNYKH